MGISRRVFVTSVLASGLFANRQALALAGEPFPVFESDAKEIPYKYRRRTVDYATAEPPGTIVVDTGQKFLFHVQGNGQATRYGVGVGKAGRTWYGEAVIGRVTDSASDVIHSCQSKTLILETPPRPWRAALKIFPTFVPAKLDRKKADQRELGAVVTFTYVPDR